MKSYMKDYNRIHTELVLYFNRAKGANFMVRSTFVYHNGKVVHSSYDTLHLDAANQLYEIRKFIAEGAKCDGRNTFNDFSALTYSLELE